MISTHRNFTRCNYARHIDGLDVYKLLQSDETTRSIPVIFTTAMVGIEERIRGRISGEIEVITKAFNIRLLETQITEQLRAIAIW